MTDKKIDSLKHRNARRTRIPSQEEAGCEQESEAARQTEARWPLNPVTQRGQDPELYWLEKYGAADRDEHLEVDIRSLYRTEHIAPEKLIQRLYTLRRAADHQADLFVDELFANYKDVDELDKPQSYYRHADRWANRLIQGDSLMVMASLLEREGMKGQVQMIYIDPPYGIKYGSNWQIRVDNPSMPDGDPDDAISGEPEVVKAFRDTWELGIHSYLAYLQQRLLVARELLAPSGSVFVQISSENVHLVRCVLDEVFGSSCFIAEILIKKKGFQKGDYIQSINDYLLWYSRQPIGTSIAKFRPYFVRTGLDDETLDEYKFAELPDGTTFPVANARTPSGDLFDYRLSPKRLASDFPKVRLFRANPMTSGGERRNQSLPFSFEGRIFSPGKGNCWKTKVTTDDGSTPGMTKLAQIGRLIAGTGQLRFKSYLDDFGYQRLSNWWDGLGGASNPVYIVQTNEEIIKRCMLMTTDPGDLVLDPTCGSGTTAHVAEQWGRRWITTDTSRVALNIAKTRLMTASYPWYTLQDEQKGLPREHWDLRHGFLYRTVQRITLGSLANDEPPEEVTLYDQPAVDRGKLRVAGPFTVETLQSYEPLAPEDVALASLDHQRMEAFQARVFEHLKTAGVKNGARNEMAVFVRVDALPDSALHAEGYYDAADGEQKAYIHLGPQFAPVSRQAVNDAVKACRARGDAQWLLILGFAFESDVENSVQRQRAGSFRVDKVRMHDDLLQAGLTRKDRKAATFVTIGEPDIALQRDGDTVRVEIRGLDLYDPIRDEVKARSVADIAYWMVDDDYDGSSFMVRQVFFCGGDRDEFDKWQRGLSDVAKTRTRRKLENTLKIEIDAEAFDRLYGFVSHPIPFRTGRRVAVRVVSQFGEESTKVLQP